MGLLDWLVFAYYDRTKCFPIFSKTTRSWSITQKSKKCIFELFNDSKKRFLAIILTYLSWVNLILHMVIVQNGSQEWATLPGLKDHSKNMNLWMIQWANNEVLGQFIVFCKFDQSDITDNGGRKFKTKQCFSWNIQVSDFIQAWSISDVEHAVYSVTVLNVSWG